MHVKKGERETERKRMVCFLGFCCNGSHVPNFHTSITPIIYLVLSDFPPLLSSFCSAVLALLGENRNEGRNTRTHTHLCLLCLAIVRCLLAPPSCN